MLVHVRPSNEALLRARVPGAQDHTGALPSPFPKPLIEKNNEGDGYALTARVQRGPSAR